MLQRKICMCTASRGAFIEGTGMDQSFESVGKFGQELIDTGLKSVASVAQNAQAIALEAAEYSERVFETNTVAAEKLVSAKSFDKVFDLQAEFANEAYKEFVSEMTKFSELYAELAKSAYLPFESLIARAR